MKKIAVLVLFVLNDIQRSADNIYFINPFCIFVAMNVETDIDTSGIFSPLHSADEGDGFYNYVELSNKGYNRIFKAQRNGKWYILKGLRIDVADRSQYQDLLAKE